MKVVLLNGSPHSNGCTFTALKEVERGLNDYGVETEIIHIGKDSIPGCKGCFACRGLYRVCKARRDNICPGGASKVSAGM